MAKIKLNDIDTRAPKGMDKEATKKKLSGLLSELDDLQNLLYAEGKHSLLVILQGMDASGKDGLIRTVFGSMNPQGVNVQSFKIPTAEELSHDFLWRIHKHTPPKGMVQVFNRSHYEDVLVTRVHEIIDNDLAKKRMKAINDFEQMLIEQNDTIIIKCYLHVSAEEQRERLDERVNIPEKRWKFNANDFREATLRNKYTQYYEEVFEKCNNIPWHIIPADQNWHKSYILAKILVDALKGLNMEYPERLPS